MERKNISAWIGENNIFDIKSIREYGCIDETHGTGTYSIESIEFQKEKIIISLFLTGKNSSNEIFEQIYRVEIKSEEKFLQILEKFEDEIEDEVMVTDLIGSVGIYIQQCGEARCFDNAKQYLKWDYDERLPEINILQLFPIGKSYF